MDLMDWLTPLSSVAGIGSSIANVVSQQQNYNYLKWAQQQTWNREDNAVQRRVADLKSAGLSPVLAAGSGASSSAPISTTAPQVHGLQESIQAAMQGLQMKKNIAQTDAQTALMQQQTRGLKLDNDQKQSDYEKLAENGALKNAPSGIVGQIVQGMSMLETAIPKIQEWTRNSKWFSFLNHDSGPSKKDTVSDYLSGKANNLTGGVASSHAVGEDSKPVYDFWRQNANERAQEYYLEQGKRGSYGNRYR